MAPPENRAKLEPEIAQRVEQFKVGEPQKPTFLSSPAYAELSP